MLLFAVNGFSTRLARPLLIATTTTDVTWWTNAKDFFAGFVSSEDGNKIWIYSIWNSF